MKKILLIIVTLFIGLGNVNAQSDATWEETTDFILKLLIRSYYLSMKIGTIVLI